MVMEDQIRQHCPTCKGKVANRTMEYRGGYLIRDESKCAACGAYLWKWEASWSTS